MSTINHHSRQTLCPLLSRVGVVSAACAAMLYLSAPAWAQDGAKEERFPDPSSSYLKEGAFVGPDHARRVELSAIEFAPKEGDVTPMTKDQVRLELGNPHFNEGLFGSKAWNYLFKFYTGARLGNPESQETITCQFKVKFNQDNRVQNTYWRDEQCATLSNPPQAKAMPVAAMVLPPSTKPAQRIALAADGLFAFGKSGLEDLQPQGREKLRNLAEQLKTQFKTVHSLIIIGHTDRIGSPKANIDLSQARAETVKSFLIDQGMSKEVIRAYGVGAAAQPVPQTAQCGAGQVPTPALVDCLQPNRRVEVEVVGES